MPQFPVVIRGTAYIQAPGHPDNSLPGDQPIIDNSLPVPPGFPDNSLPVPPPGIWGPTDPRPTPPIYLVPPGSLGPGIPTLPIYLPPGIWGPTDPRPTHPIVIPPGYLGGGKPEHPIYLPPPLVIWGGGNVPMPNPPIYFPPGIIDGVHPEHPIVIPPMIWGGGNVPMPTPPIELPDAPNGDQWVLVLVVGPPAEYAMALKSSLKFFGAQPEPEGGRRK